MTCKKQEEQKILTICRDRLSEKIIRDIFILTYDRLRKYQGVWHLEQQLLFPGYIFLECEEEKGLLEELKKVHEDMGCGKRLIRVSREEERFLRKLFGKEHHLEMSRGIISEGSTKITEGPLKGMENRICRIDRHKRLARVEIGRRTERYEQAGRSGADYCYISVGLEITEKVRPQRT